jgi:uncharacterized protein (TIRG00374 family)
MKKIIILLIFSLLGLTFFVHILITTGLDKIWQIFQGISLHNFLLFLCTIASVFLVFTWRWQIILKAYEPKITFRQLFWKRAVGFAISYLTPVAHVGGEVARAFFLHHDKEARLRDATASVIIDKMLEISVNTLLIATGFVLALRRGFLSEKASLWLTVLLVGGAFLLGLFFQRAIAGQGIFTKIFRLTNLHKFQRLKKFEKKLMRLEKLLQDYFQKHRQSLLPTALLSVLAGGLVLLEYWVGLYIVGHTATLTEILIIFGLSSITFLLPIPGALGAYEGAMMGVFHLLNLPIPLALAFVLILRLRDLSFSVFGIVYSVRHGLKWAGVLKVNSR